MSNTIFPTARQANTQTDEVLAFLKEQEQIKLVNDPRFAPVISAIIQRIGKGHKTAEVHINSIDFSDFFRLVKNQGYALFKSSEMERFERMSESSDPGYDGPNDIKSFIISWEDADLYEYE